MKFYADKFRRIRQLKRISVQGMAETLDISRSSLWSWEKGKRNPSESNIRALAKAVNTDVTEISDLPSLNHTILKDFAEPVRSLLEIANSDVDMQTQTTQILKQQIDMLDNRLNNASVIVKALISSLDTAFYIKSTNQQFIIANNAFLKMLELNIKKDLFGKEDKDIFSLKEARSNIEQDKKVLKKGEPLISIESYLPGTRKKKVGLISKIPIFDTKGRIVGIMGVFTDITNLKKTQKSLQKSEAMYKHLANNLPAVLYQFKVSPDGEFSIPYMSSKSINILGISHEDIMHDSSFFFNRIHPEDQQIVHESITRASKTFEVFPVTFRFMNGIEVLWLEANGTPKKLPDGSNLWDGILFDITEHKLQEEKIEKSEEKHRDFLFNLSDIVYQTDISGNLVYANKSLEKATGMLLKNMINKPFLPLYTEDSQKVANDDYQRAIKGEPTQSELTFKNGRTFRYNDKPLTDSKGNIIGIFGMARDITERKKAEDKLKFAKERLNLVLECTKTGIWEWNIKTGEGFIDKNYCDILGYDQEDLDMNVDTWKELIHPDDIDSVMNKINKHFNNPNYVYSSEFRMKKKNGDWIWIMSKGKVVEQDSNGKPVRMIGINNDITERK